jgi:TatD DNase family protein
LTDWIVDSHCHLDYDGLSEDLSAVLARANSAGVGLLLTISSRVRNHTKIVEIIEKFQNVFGTVGTHPHNAHEEMDVTPDLLVTLAQHEKIIAIGEVGLDYFYDNSPREAQMEGFKRHIAAARSSGLPLIIHTRDAEDDTARILEDEMRKGEFKAVLHCFTGKQWLAEKAVAMGLLVSFSGILTYKTAEDLRRTAAALPSDKILVETDAPFLAPIPHRGKPNEPAFVAKTLEHLAEIRGETLSNMAKQTSNNFFRYFSKVPATARFKQAA